MTTIDPPAATKAIPRHLKLKRASKRVWKKPASRSGCDLGQSANAHVIWSADYSRNSLFGWFVAGLVVYALLLIFATVAGKPGAA